MSRVFKIGFLSCLASSWFQVAYAGDEFECTNPRYRNAKIEFNQKSLKLQDQTIEGMEIVEKMIEKSFGPGAGVQLMRAALEVPRRDTNCRLARRYLLECESSVQRAYLEVEGVLQNETREIGGKTELTMIVALENFKLNSTLTNVTDGTHVISPQVAGPKGAVVTRDLLNVVGKADVIFKGERASLTWTMPFHFGSGDCKDL